MKKDEIFGFGLKFIDNFIGGLQNGLNMIYGIPGVGKSTFAYHFAKNITKMNKNVIYFDNDHAFNIDRFLQIARNDKNLLTKLIIFKPKSVNEFKLMIENLNKFNENIGGIVVDSIAMPYRVQFIDQSVRKMVGEMLNDVVRLRNFAEEHKLPVLLINQVYSNVIGGKKRYEMVGSENMKYLVPIILELNMENGKRVLRIIKHPTKPNAEFLFEIDDFGIKPYHKFMKKSITKFENLKK